METTTTTRLCSDHDPLTRLACDLPAKHRGPHRASTSWGDEFLAASKGLDSEAPWDMSHE